MGFGTLFFGYFVTFAFSLSKYYFFADIIGILVVIYAFTKLTKYNLYFRGAMIPALAYLIFCAAAAAALMFDIYAPDSIYDTAVDLLKLVSACAIHILMCLGTRGIALGAGSGADKTAKRARVNLIAAIIYYAADLAVFVVFGLTGKEAGAVNAVLLCAWLVLLIMYLVMFYGAFAVICPADEDETVIKRSKIPIINKINDKMDAFEKKSNDYRRESMEMAMKEAERIAAEKEKKYPHKKRKKK